MGLEPRAPGRSAPAPAALGSSLAHESYRRQSPVKKDCCRVWSWAWREECDRARPAMASDKCDRACAAVRRAGRVEVPASRGSVAARDRTVRARLADGARRRGVRRRPVVRGASRRRWGDAPRGCRVGARHSQSRVRGVDVTRNRAPLVGRARVRRRRPRRRGSRRRTTLRRWHSGGARLRGRRSRWHRERRHRRVVPARALDTRRR